MFSADVDWDSFLDLKLRQDDIRGIVRALASVVAEYSGTSIRFVIFEFDPGTATVPFVSSPEIVDTSAAVKEALVDLDTAIRDGRPLSGVDRAHTAIQGHLEHLCSGVGIPFKPRSEITFLFREIVSKHPLFADPIGHSERVRSATQGLARVVDALGPARNHGSIAHANEVLLGDAEGWHLS